MACPRTQFFISGLDKTVKGFLVKLANDTKMDGMVNTLEGSDKIQSDKIQLEKWAAMNKMQFDRDKCKVLYLDSKNVMHA